MFLPGFCTHVAINDHVYLLTLCIRSFTSILSLPQTLVFSDVFSVMLHELASDLLQTLSFARLFMSMFHLHTSYLVEDVHCRLAGDRVDLLIYCNAD